VAPLNFARLLSAISLSSEGDASFINQRDLRAVRRIVEQLPELRPVRWSALHSFARSAPTRPTTADFGSSIFLLDAIGG